MPSSTVIDASAVLALLNDEPGADAVAARLAGGILSTVNLAEVVSVLADNGVPDLEIRFAISALGLVSVAFDDEMAHFAGALRPKTKALGLSLGDRACLALALHSSSSVLTADRSWRELRIGIEVELIR
jgi:PIN domain nuclease of toxin-antitoxin system